MTAVAGKELTQGETTRQDELYAVPPVDIFEKEGAIVLTADLPGVKPEGLSVNLDNGILTIEGKTTGTGGGTYLTKEFEPASFYRRFRVTDEIDEAGIRAGLKNGVLTLTLPRRAKAKPLQIRVEN